MGEKHNQPFQLSFPASWKVDFQGSRVTPTGGPTRAGVGMSGWESANSSSRNYPLPLIDRLRQSVYNRLAGYEDVNAAGRVSQDPTFRPTGSEKIWEGGAALTSRLQSCEAELQAKEQNLAGLAATNRELTAKLAKAMGRSTSRGT